MIVHKRLVPNLNLRTKQKLHNTMEHYITIQNITEQYRTLQNVTEHYRTLQNITEGFIIEQINNNPYISLKITT